MMIISWHFHNIRLTIFCIFPVLLAKLGTNFAFTHHVMCKSLVVTTCYTWKMWRRIFYILSFSETFDYIRHDWH